MKYLHVIVMASAVALAMPAAAAISASNRTGETHQIGSRGVQQAKFKWPKIHKCKPINKGIECEIKVSELPPREQTERAAAESIARASAVIENNRRLEDAKRRSTTA